MYDRSPLVFEHAQSSEFQVSNRISLSPLEASVFAVVVVVHTVLLVVSSCSIGRFYLSIYQVYVEN